MSSPVEGKVAYMDTGAAHRILAAPFGRKRQIDLFQLDVPGFHRHGSDPCRTISLGTFQTGLNRTLEAID